MSRISRPKVLGGVAAVVLSLGLVVAGGATPADAAAADCPKGYSCIWRDTLWQSAGSGNGLVKFQQYIPDYRAHSYAVVGGGANDTASSVMNNGVAEAVRFFEHATQGGAFIELARGGSDGNIHDAAGVVNKVFSDRISSGYFSYCWNKSCW